MRGRWVCGVVVAALALCGEAFGHSISSSGPLADIDELSVGAMIGNSLGIETDRGRPLLDSDHKTADILTAALIAAASDHLRKAGIRVTKNANSSVSFDLFGGKFEHAGDKANNFFMLQIMVCEPGQERCFPERTILGVVDDQGLSRAVIAAGLSALDVVIEQRAAYRKQKSQ